MTPATLRATALRLFLVLCCLAGPALAGDELGLTLSLTGDRPVEVLVDTRLDKAGWLGVSWYAPGVTDPTKGEHSVFEAVAGRDRQVFQVPVRLVGGAVECALWGRKVLKKDCATQCSYCQTSGFHLEQRKGYLYCSLAEVSR